MNWKRVSGLSLLIILGGYFFQRNQESVTLSASNEQPIVARVPATSLKTKPEIKKQGSEPELSGLSMEKMKVLIELRDFHALSPALTPENISKRQALLDELFSNPKESVAEISNVMKNSKDDGLKSFLLNLTMNSDLEDEEKADIFFARLTTGADISPEGLVPDEQLSFMIGLSHLSRLENEIVKHHALEKLKDNDSYSNNSGFRRIIQDYF